MAGTGIRIAVALAAAFAAISGAAYAQTPDQVIAFLDKDGDGKVSLNDYLLFQLPKLAQFDANANGELSLKEFRDSLEGEGKRNAERSYRTFNANGAGMTQQEFLGYHAYVFRTFVDTDKDGFMSAEEWAKLMGR